MATAEFIATIDSAMEALSPNNNIGSDLYIFLGAVYLSGSKSKLYRPIGNFDVSSLAGATINTALLRRNITSVTGGGFAAHFYRCTRPADWVEEQVAWNNYKTSTAWSSAGGDYSTTTPAGIAYNEATGTGTFDVSGFASFVTDALASRSGIVSLIGTPDDGAPGSSKYVEFEANHASASAPWRLVVDYTPAGGSKMRHWW